MRLALSLFCGIFLMLAPSSLQAASLARSDVQSMLASTAAGQ